MSSEIEDRCLAVEENTDDQNREFRKESKISYTREVILSFSELDVCRELPRGLDLDDSVLRELEVCSRNLPQSGHDSVTGPLGSSPCSPMWLNPEKGLLGNGAFPRISKCAQETSAPILQNCSSSLLNRSSEPYRPPHLLKPQAKSPGTEIDQHNEETFGSSERVSQEKVDKERRRRRESFELRRKEQERALQDKKKEIVDEHKENTNPGTLVLEDAGGGKKQMNKFGASNVSEPFFAPNCDPESCETTLILTSTQLSPGIIGKALENNLDTGPQDPPPLSLELSDCEEDRANIHLSHSSELAYSILEEGIILEDSFLSKWFGYYSANNQSPKNWSTDRTEDSQSSSFETRTIFHCYNSSPQRRMDLSDVAGSLKLRNKSDEFFASGTGNITNLLNLATEGHSGGFEKNPSSPIILTASPKDSETTESSYIRNSEMKVPRNGVSAPPVLPRDIYIASSTFDHSSNEPATKHRSISSSTEIDDICLPDEDSLITFDDILFPMDPFSLDEDRSDSQADFPEKQADSGIPLITNTSSQNSSILQSGPQACHPQPDPEKSNAHQAQQSTKSKLPDLRSYRCKPRVHPPCSQPLGYVPYQHAYYTAPPFNHPFNQQMLPNSTYYPNNFAWYAYDESGLLCANPYYQHYMDYDLADHVIGGTGVYYSTAYNAQGMYGGQV